MALGVQKFLAGKLAKMGSKRHKNHIESGGSSVIRKEIQADIGRVMELQGLSQSTASYRNMLDNIHLKCYVEAATTHQGGTVDKIIRNRDGLPVCLRVRCGVNGRCHDYISVDRVSMWEPYDYCVPDSEYEMSLEEIAMYLEANGYHWDIARKTYVNDEGEEIAW